ncbi:MAG: hypothetical protein AUI83_14605 [Armatimonadetes bacterium 13_1_40CM_3_65_7]|nr:MAG: hypothetical protein AUI83_14605 [Armatimonadetes bacterium 13_1_40CM_3_65_7]
MGSQASLCSVRNLSASSRDGEGGHRIRAPDGIQQGCPFPEEDGQIADEGIAGSGRVDRVDPDRGNVLRSPCVEHERAPSVMMTTRGPRLRRMRPAAAASSTVVTGRPVRLWVSVSLGTQRSQSLSNSSGSAAAGAGFRMVVTLAALAMRKAFRVVSTGISSWQIGTSAARTAGVLRRRSAGESPMLAPESQ